MTDYDREFALRQVRHLRGSGLSAEQARARISSQIGHEISEELVSAAAELGAERSPLIRRLLDFGQAKNLDLAQLSASILEMRGGLQARLLPELRRFGGLYLYVTLISSAVLIILVLFTVFIIPQFSLMFDAFGMDLPGLTRLLMDSLVQWLLVGALFLLAAVLFSVSKMAKGVFALRRDPGSWLIRFPLFSRAMKAFDLWMHVLVFELLLRSGASAETLRSEVSGLVHGDRKRSDAEQERVRQLIARLTAAQALGTVDDELEYWDSRYESDLTLTLDRSRSMLGFGIQIALGLIVGAVVVGLYLPIFAVARIG